MLRGLKFAEKLLNTVLDFAKDRGCNKLISECAAYSCRAIGFYDKYFKLDKIYYEDDLKFFVYHIIIDK